MVVLDFAPTWEPGESEFRREKMEEMVVTFFGNGFCEDIIIQSTDRQYGTGFAGERIISFINEYIFQWVGDESVCSLSWV